MGWLSLADTIIKLGLKIFEAIDRARSRDAAKERAKRVQELKRRIDANPASGLNELFRSGKPGKRK